MTQPPPNQEASDAEVRRRIEMANYPAAPPSSSSMGGYSEPQFPPPPMAQQAIADDSPSQATSKAVVVVVVALASLAVIAGIIFLFVLGMNDGAPQPQVVATTSQAVAQPTGVATPEPTTDADPTEDAQPDAVGPPFASRMDTTEMYDAYTAMVTDQSIFDIVPATPEGADYVQAFFLAVVDYKAAESFSPLSATQKADLAALELRFLALEDLDVTIDITFSDGTRFTHDGHPPARA